MCNQMHPVIVQIPVMTLLLTVALREIGIVDTPNDTTYHFNATTATCDGYGTNRPIHRICMKAVQEWKNFKYLEALGAKSPGDLLYFEAFGNGTEICSSDYYNGLVFSANETIRLDPVERQKLRSLWNWHNFAIPYYAYQKLCSLPMDIIKAIDEILERSYLPKETHRWLRLIAASSFHTARSHWIEASSVPGLGFFNKTVEVVGYCVMLRMIMTMLRVCWHRILGVIKWARKMRKGYRRHAWDLYQSFEDTSTKIRLGNSGTISTIRKRIDLFALYEWDEKFAVATFELERHLSVVMRTGGIDFRASDVLALTTVNNIGLRFCDLSDAEVTESEVTFVLDMYQETDLTDEDLIAVIGCSGNSESTRRSGNVFLSHLQLCCSLWQVDLYSRNVHLVNGLVVLGNKHTDQDIDGEEEQDIAKVSEPVFSLKDGKAENEQHLAPLIIQPRFDQERALKTYKSSEDVCDVAVQTERLSPTIEHLGIKENASQGKEETAKKRTVVRSKSLVTIQSPNSDSQKDASKKVLKKVWRTVPKSSSPLPVISPTEFSSSEFPKSGLSRTLEVVRSPKITKNTKIPRKSGITPPQKIPQRSVFSEQRREESSPRSYSSAIHMRSPVPQQKPLLKAVSSNAETEVTNMVTQNFLNSKSPVLLNSLRKASALFAAREPVKSDEPTKTSHGSCAISDDTAKYALFERPALSHQIIQKFPSYFDLKTEVYHPIITPENFMGRRPTVCKQEVFRSPLTSSIMNARKPQVAEPIRNFAGPVGGSFVSPRFHHEHRRLEPATAAVNNFSDPQSSGDARAKKDPDKSVAFRPPDKNHISRKRNRSLSMSSLKKPDVIRSKNR